MIAKENDESRRKREFINLIKLGCLNCQVQQKKKKQFYIHISNRILTCTENHRSCKTTNEKITIFQRMQKYKDKSFLTQKFKLFSVARYWGTRKSSSNNPSLQITMHTNVTPRKPTNARRRESKSVPSRHTTIKIEDYNNTKHCQIKL